MFLWAALISPAFKHILLNSSQRGTQPFEILPLTVQEFSSFEQLTNSNQLTKLSEIAPSLGCAHFPWVSSSHRYPVVATHPQTARHETHSKLETAGGTLEVLPFGGPDFSPVGTTVANGRASHSCPILLSSELDCGKLALWSFGKFTTGKTNSARAVNPLFARGEIRLEIMVVWCCSFHVAPSTTAFRTSRGSIVFAPSSFHKPVRNSFPPRLKLWVGARDPSSSVCEVFPLFSERKLKSVPIPTNGSRRRRRWWQNEIMRKMWLFRVRGKHW